MEKEEKRIFPRMMFFAALILLVNIGSFIYKYGELKSGGLTGFSVTSLEKTVLNIGGMSFVSRIFLIVQWSIIFFVLIYAFFKDKSVLVGKEEVNSISSFKGSKKNKTDLDVFHDILKKKKSLKISTVAKSFNVSKDVATDWSKILESGELATIEYPGFGEPRVVIKEKEVENVENKEGGVDSKKEGMENKEKGIEDNNKKSKDKKNENLNGEKKQGFFGRFIERFRKKKEVVEEIDINKFKKNNSKINNVSKKVDKKLIVQNNKNVDKKPIVQNNIKKTNKKVGPINKKDVKKGKNSKKKIR